MRTLVTSPNSEGGRSSNAEDFGSAPREMGSYGRVQSIKEV
jgi:hypothetical protein